MNRRNITGDDILKRAASEHITADELDILVTRTREISAARSRQLKQLQSLLSNLETRLQNY